MTAQDENKKKLEDFVKRKETLQARAERAKGRLDGARKELETIAAECRKKGVEPDQLQEAISKLQGKFDALTADLALRIEGAEKDLAPYLEES